jgi:Flp pilus assembly protein TadG
MKLFSRAIRKFRRQEEGMMAIEFVIMVPLFVAMISGVVDLSRVFVDQANYYSVARDTARIVSRHGMTDESAEDYALARVGEISYANTEIEVSSNSTNVTVTISAPIAALSKFGFLDFLNTMSLTASVTHAMEPV